MLLDKYPRFIFCFKKCGCYRFLLYFVKIGSYCITFRKCSVGKSQNIWPTFYFNTRNLCFTYITIVNLLIKLVIMYYVFYSHNSETILKDLIFSTSL